MTPIPGLDLITIEVEGEYALKCGLLGTPQQVVTWWPNGVAGRITRPGGVILTKHYSPKKGDESHFAFIHLSRQYLSVRHCFSLETQE